MTESADDTRAATASNGWLFATALFLSAYLLFFLQPLMGRYILPWFGGGTAVWTACMLFFQAALLLGYAYAHLLDGWLSRHHQALVHTVVLLSSLLFLPIAPDARWLPEGTEAPDTRILLLLAATVGVPFVALAATTPLLSAWYRERAAGGSPYRLYALSNAGSLLGLLAYPLIIEPGLSLSGQSLLWAAVYGIFVINCLACAWGSARTGGESLPMEMDRRDSPEKHGSGSSWRQFLHWVILAATGSVMLLATTSQVSQEVSVVPMLWIPPLAIYLLSFIFCFERDGWYDRRLFVPLLLITATLVVMHITRLGTLGYLQQLGIFLACQFACTMCCHGELARLRPAPTHLTRFYLALSVGGAIGGVFSSLVAPRVFSGFWEYQLALLATLALVALALVRDARAKTPGNEPAPLVKRVAIPVCAGLVVSGFAGILGLQARSWSLNMVETARNFYGINKVVDGTGISGPYRELYNGAIAHGVQLLNPDLENIPTQYYGHRSGLALAIRLLREQRPVEAGLNIGVVGLGVGTIAALAEEGDRVRFYEINPEVERLASRHFSFLADSPAEVEVILGDARIALAREAARGDHQGFDLLVLDAFNSDSVPVHLLTREAYSLFRSHLRPGGVLAFHTSNRHLGLSPNVRALAAHHGDEAVRIANVREGWFRVDASRWVLTSDDPQFLTAGQLSVEATPWQDGETTDRPWSDDYSSLVDAFQLKRHAATNKWLAAPNQGLFVYDIAGLIEESQEAHMRDISRALYADTRPGVPVFVVTANTMRDRHGRPVPTGELPAQFARSIGLDQWRSQFEIVVFILLEEKRIEILVGDSWPAETRRELEARLQQTLQASLGSHSLSDTLLRMTREADRLIRSLVER